MLKPKLLLSLALMMALSVGGSVFAQEQISGPQSGILGPGTYLVVGDIQVQRTATLEIVPGTEFLHNGNWTWQISGQLNAAGIEGDSIYFVRQNPIDAHRWGGIRFLAGASSASTLDYCVIDHCYHGLQPYYNNGGGIYSDGVAVSIRNTRVSNCSNYWDGGGIYAKAANVIIDRCLIVDNSAASGSNGGGIFLKDCSEATVTYCVTARNSATGT